MEAKLSLKVDNASLKVAGTESFVVKMRKAFEEKYLSPEDGSHVSPKNKTPSTKSLNNKSPKGKSSKSSNTNQRLTTVPEIFDDKAVDFGNEYEKYEVPPSYAKKTALFVYIMSESLGIKDITVNHIYSCYRLAKISPPKHIKQSVRNAKSENLILHDNWEDIKVHSTGLIDIPKFPKKEISDETG